MDLILAEKFKCETKLKLLHTDQNTPEEWQNDDEIVQVGKVNGTLLHPAKSNSRLFRIGDNWDLALTSVEIAQKNSVTPRLVVAGG